MKKNDKHIIPLRTTLTADIFKEMEELYPTVSPNGIEYKQTFSFIGFPVDFDFNELYDFASDSDIDPAHAIAVLLVCLTKMGESYGYYFVAHRRTAKEIGFVLDIDGEEIQKILDFLVEFSYLYNFDGRITSVIAVRNFECLQSSRIRNRESASRKSLYSNKKPVKTDETEEPEHPPIDLELFKEVSNSPVDGLEEEKEETSEESNAAPITSDYSLKGFEDFEDIEIDKTATWF